MFALRDKETIARRFSRPYRVFERKARTPLHPATLPSTELVVDSKGVIIDCSDDLVQAIQATKDQLIGKNVRALIPALPFQVATEGYNIAYATFAAARKEASTWGINAAGDSRIEVTGRIAIHRMTGGYAIRLAIGSMTPVARIQQHGGRTHHSGPAHVAAYCASSTGLACRSITESRPATQTQSSRRGSHVRLVLDSKYRIGYASSTLEDLFGMDYEQVVGVPASVLLPDLQNYLGHASTLRSARTRLRKMGPFVSQARHANGNAIPVMVSLQEESVDRLAALQLHVAIC